MWLAVDADGHLIKMPAPVRPVAQVDPPPLDLPPNSGPMRFHQVPYRLVADVDTALEQQILDLSQRQRVAELHHHREWEYLERTVEIAEGISHLAML